MTFGVFLPPQAELGDVPALWFLSGLTCTHENAMTKAGAQRDAARLGLALIFPDTSPRGDAVADDASYDLGKGAGFYLNATQRPWSAHYKMWDYIADELPKLVCDQLPIRADAMGVTGHSMGGHGALILAISRPDLFRSLSAFAPIANPSQSDWGRKQFNAYLGPDEDAWQEYDACALMSQKGYPGEILIDQGDADPNLELLRPEALANAMAMQRQPGAFRFQPGYDHSYFFVQSFIPEHLVWHAERLCSD